MIFGVCWGPGRYPANGLQAVHGPVLDDCSKVILCLVRDAIGIAKIQSCFQESNSHEIRVVRQSDGLEILIGFANILVEQQPGLIQ